MIRCLTLALAAMLGALACAQPPAKDPAAAEPAIATADDLLTALETADQGIKSLQAEVKYIRDSGVLQGNNTVTRQGMLFFRADFRPASAPDAPAAPPRRAFAVDFDVEIVNTQVRKERRVFIFDGEWFVEKNYKDHQSKRERIVPKGQTADPLRIGSGPFPIPIGQKRSDILSRFTAQLLPPGDGIDEKDRQQFADTYQLKLVPRVGADEARDYDEIRLWYRKKDLLPSLARTVNPDGARSEVFLVGPEPNRQIPDQTFDTSPVPPGSGWDEDTQEYRKPADKKP